MDNQSSSQQPQRDREHVAELRQMIAAMEPRTAQARKLGADPEGRLPRLHEGLLSANEALWELRLAHKGGRYLWLSTAKTIGDALGEHVGGLGLPSVKRGGGRYFVIDGTRVDDETSTALANEAIDATVEAPAQLTS